MSFSLFQKARVVTLGNLHELANRMIDLNSPAAVEQFIRDLETAKTTVGQSIASNTADLAGVTRDLNNLHALEAELNTQAQSLVAAGKDDSAKQVLTRLDSVEQQIAPKEQAQHDFEAVRTNLKQTMSALDAKIAAMNNQLQALRSMTQRAKSLEVSTSALTAANNAASSVDGVNIDDMNARAQRRVDEAQARFEQANGAIQDNVGDDLASVRADERLAALKAKMNQPTAAAV